MEPRFKLVDTHLSKTDGSPTGEKRYRVLDTQNPSDPSKYGVYEDREEASQVCDTLNAENLK
jgi:hypothetical protein